MSKHVSQRGDDIAASLPLGQGAAGTGSPAAEGGESACWAHLVCPECGAMTSEGHRQACSLAVPAASGGC